MADQYDPYRDALVVEAATVWPEEFAQLDAVERARIEGSLQADPASAAELEYVRLSRGFCRRITVTAEDVKRLKEQQEAGP